MIFREAILRLKHDDAFKLWQCGFHVLPDPNRDIFRCRIFKAFDVVQIFMVEPLEQRLELSLDGKKIGNKACNRIDRSFEPQFHAVRMAMEPPAAMAFAGIGQSVRRIETKCLRDFQKRDFNFISCRRIYAFEG